MATTTLEHEEHSKRDRILNALAIYPGEYRMSNQAIAELTGASASYVYQLRAAIEEGEVSTDEVERARDDQLLSQYRDRLDDLLEEAGVPRTTGEDRKPRPIVEDAMESPINGTVPVEEVERIRTIMERYREDAAFERDRFEGAGKDIAEEKYIIASRAIELLDDVIEA